MFLRYLGQRLIGLLPRVNFCASLFSFASDKMTDASQLGFGNLPFLAHRKSVKKGFEFTLMVVGELEQGVVLYCTESNMHDS